MPPLHTHMALSSPLILPRSGRDRVGSFTNVSKSQNHYNCMKLLSFSPDGSPLFGSKARSADANLSVIPIKTLFHHISHPLQYSLCPRESGTNSLSVGGSPVTPSMLTPPSLPPQNPRSKQKLLFAAPRLHCSFIFLPSSPHALRIPPERSNVTSETAMGVVSYPWSIHFCIPIGIFSRFSRLFYFTTAHIFNATRWIME